MHKHATNADVSSHHQRRTFITYTATYPTVYSAKAAMATTRTSQP